MPTPTEQLAEKLTLLSNGLDQVLSHIHEHSEKSDLIEARLLAHEKKAKEKGTVYLDQVSNQNQNTIRLPHMMSEG